MNAEAVTITPHDLEEARERGQLAGEVRNLKWGTGIAVVALFACLGVIYTETSDLRAVVDTEVREDLIRVEEGLKRVDARVAQVEERVAKLEERTAKIEERTGHIEKRVIRVEERLEQVAADVGEIKALLHTLVSKQT